MNYYSKVESVLEELHRLQIPDNIFEMQEEIDELKAENESLLEKIEDLKYEFRELENQ